MFLGLLTLITALSISAVAIYYSVAGLVAIFAAAAVPIIIMGGVLEIGKLVTAVWLHKYWSRATWWLKTYLSMSVAILMFITSMGIFGFLSKAHIEQTSAAGEGVAQIEQIQKTIASQQAVIARAEQIIETTQTSGTGADQNIQSQIDREQKRIDTAYDRVQPAIDSTNEKLESDKQFFLDQLPAIDEKLAQFNQLSTIDTNDEEAVKRLQSLVGSRPDGAYGNGTARAVSAYKETLEQERTNIFAKIEELKAGAQKEIARLRSRAEAEIDDSNKLIGRLRSQLGTSTGEDIDAIIDEQNARIKAANTELDNLTEEKFTLEAEYRKLEAEVGPIKYIAEFVYGEQADKNLLEEAVRWVIIVIIFVFDPLAVLLLIASQYTFNWYREGKEHVTTEEESTPDPAGQSNDLRTDDTGSSADNSQRMEIQQEEDTEKFEEQVDDTVDSTPTITGTSDNVGDSAQAVALARQKLAWDNATTKEVEGLVDDLSKVTNPTREEIAASYLPVQKKEFDIESQEESSQERERREAYEEKERDEKFAIGKHAWKEENPDKTLKHYKNLYIKGLIDQLPWEETTDKDNYNGEGRIKPDFTEVIEPEGYQQNGEQNESTLFNKLRNK